MENDNYQRVSAPAVVSLLIAVLSLLAFLSPDWIPATAAAIALSLWARRSIHHYELAGLRCANWALMLSCAIAVVTPIRWCIAYRLEAGSNAVRLNFADVARDKVNIEDLQGRQVMLKGYAILPTSNTSVAEFTFTYDGTSHGKVCAVAVQLPAGKSWDYDHYPLAITGRLELCNDDDSSEGQPRYLLREPVIRRSLTPFDLAHCGRSGC